jgi:enamine deaminase RidA (YjgF/YER057c/UK114 family)
MSHTRTNPTGLFDSKAFGFTQLVVSEGGKTLHCSGQTAWNSALEVIGAGDLAAQAKESFRNVGIALAAAGAGPSDVVRVRVYIVDHKPDYLPIVGQAMVEFFGADNLPASTLIGVQRLAVPEFMIEIEATAVL